MTVRKTLYMDGKLDKRLKRVAEAKPHLSINALLNELIIRAIEIEESAKSGKPAN